LSEVNLAAASESNVDFSVRLGISKWVPEVPEYLSGQAVSAVQLRRWIEIEDIKRYPNIFRPGEPVIANEKIHGTTLCATWVSESAELFVSSKGLAAQRLAFDESQNNAYWRAVRIFDIGGLLRDLVGPTNVTRISLYAEVYGTGVQDLHYGATDENLPGLAVFDIAVDEAYDSYWLTQALVRDICFYNRLKYAPVLYEGGYDYEVLAALAEGHTSLGNGMHLREGLVVRSVPERHSTVVNGRAIAKFVGNGYLSRSGGTEYE
jgi:RNA ligase (TIGR02306 family)